MRFIYLIAFLLLPFCLLAQLSGKVVKVADGDTFTLLTEDNKQVKVRLHGIDCPEKGQDFGQVAKQYTSDVVYLQVVRVKATDTDRYGRTVGIVTRNDGTVLNEALLTAGLAWHYTKYDKNSRWAAIEQKARNKKVGLWTMPGPVAPWDWRKKK